MAISCRAGARFSRRWHAWNLQAINGAISPVTRIHKCRNQGGEVQLSPPTITTSNPTAKFLFPLPRTFIFCWPGGHCAKGGTLLPGDIVMILSNWNWRQPSSHFGFLRPLHQQAKKGDNVLAGVTDHDYQWEIEQHSLQWHLSITMPYHSYWKQSFLLFL